AQLAPIGGDHVRSRWQSGRTAKLCHHLACRKDALSTTRILGIGHYAVQIAAKPHGVLQPPATIWIKGYTRLGKALMQRTDRVNFLFATQYSTFQFEVVETVAG